MSAPVCRKCLLKDLSDSEHYQNVYEYIESLDEYIKTDKSAYEKRLEGCRQCDNLINGMCRLCGCFVEMRAVIAGKHCPLDNPVW